MPRGRKGVPANEATKKQIRDKIHYLNEGAEMPFDASKLSFNERRLLVVLSDPRQHVEKWTIAQVCEAAGISYGAYRSAIANPDFIAAQNSVVQAAIKQAVLPLVRAGVKYAMEGSYRHWEALMKLGGTIETENSDKEIVIRFAGAQAPLVIDGEIVAADGNAPRLPEVEGIAPRLPVVAIDELTPIKEQISFEQLAGEDCINDE